MKKTSFRLSEDQELELQAYVKQRLESLELDNDERIKADKKSWYMYENDRRDRLDGIYSRSNTPVPLTSLIVDHFVARAEEDLTGAPPYFRFDAQGVGDVGKAEDFDRYFNWKIEKRGRVREVLEEAHLQSFIQRAVILKTTYEEDVTRYYDYEARVLYDTVSGVFVDLPDYGMIVEGHATFVPIPNPVDPEGAPVIALEGKPEFVLDPVRHEFREYEGSVELEVTRYKGPRGVIVDYDRVFMPSRARSVDEMDCIIEKYDKPLNWVEELWLERGFRMWELAEDQLKGNDATEKTESEKDQDIPTESLGFDREAYSIPILECWMRRDVLGLGYPQEFVVFLDAVHYIPIYYEYTCKVTPDKRVPYTVVSIGRSKGLWWGKSVPERIEVYQNYIDKQFNGQSYRNELASNPIKGANPEALEEEPENVELDPDVVYRLKPNYNMKDFLSFAELPKDDSRTQDLIDFIFGVVQLWLGVTNLAQGDYQALAPANTATGVEATLREASKIGRRWMRRMIEGYEVFLMKLVKVGAATLDEAEVYEYMEGDLKSFATMDPGRLHQLEVDVTLEMAQDQSQRTIERNDLGLKTMERYFSYQPDIRPFVRPMLVNLLKALKFDEAESLLPEGAPDVPRDDTGKPVETPPQLTGAVEGMGNSNSRGANQYQAGVGR
jgi:hypothetical protein